jgi:hypothetical protein
MRNEYSSRRPVAWMITSSDFGRAETLLFVRHPELTINRDYPVDKGFTGTCYPPQP